MGEAKRRKLLDPNWGKPTQDREARFIGILKTDELIESLKNIQPDLTFSRSQARVIKASPIAWQFSIVDDIAGEVFVIPCVLFDEIFNDVIVQLWKSKTNPLTQSEKDKIRKFILDNVVIYEL